MTKYLAIDIGASSGRHILFWIENGKLLQKELYRFKNGPFTRNGALIWDADRLVHEVREGLRCAGEAGLAPDYVGIDTWAVDYALLDRNGARIGDIFCYRSDRTAGAIERMHAAMPFSTLYEHTGIQFQPFNTLYQLCADRESGKLDGAAHFLMLPDYLNYTLTGIMRQEYTNATSTGMVNALTHTWDEDILTTAGLPRHLFGALTQPGSVVGQVTEEVAREIGYRPTVLLPATHDTASAVLAAPIRTPAPYISSGTWSLLGLCEPHAHTDPASMAANWSNEGAPDFAFRYQKNIMGLWMLQSIRRELGEDVSFEALIRMAESAPGGITVDVNHPDFLAPDSMLDAVRHHAPACRDTAALVRCVYDSLALCYKTSIEELERTVGRHFDVLHIIGGGCRDTLLNRLTAEATGKTVLPGPVEATAIGNALMQLKATHVDTQNLII